MTDQTPAEEFAEAVEQLFAHLDQKQSLEPMPANDHPAAGPDWAVDLMHQIATDTERNTR